MVHSCVTVKSETFNQPLMRENIVYWTPRQGSENKGSSRKLLGIGILKKKGKTTENCLAPPRPCIYGSKIHYYVCYLYPAGSRVQPMAESKWITPHVIEKNFELWPCPEQKLLRKYRCQYYREKKQMWTAEAADRESQTGCHLWGSDFTQSISIQLAAIHNRKPLSISFHLSGKSL